MKRDRGDVLKLEASAALLNGLRNLMRRAVEASLRTCSHVYSCELGTLTYLLHQEVDAAKRERILLEPVVFKLRPSVGFQGKRGALPGRYICGTAA